MFDMRAYTISLVAVFLALGIGIVLGTVIQDKGILEKNWKGLVKRIELQVEDLRAEKRELQGRVSRLQQFEAQVLPLVISGQLTGKVVTVVATPSFPDPLEARTIRLLEQSGAFVRRINLQKEFFALPRERTGEVEALFAAKVSQNTEPQARLVEGVAQAIVSESALPNLQTLAGSGFVTVQGSAEGSPSVVILAVEPRRDSEAVDGVLRPFLAEARRAGAAVVVVEPEESRPTLVPAFRAVGASTVDNVDKVSGQIALVYLAGGKSGSFGVKQLGLPLLPPPP